VVRARLEAVYRDSRIDPLTGLPNRRAFFERCAAELNRALRFRRPVTLVLLDGDDFKSVNDRHGHAVGDRALRKTAQVLLQAVRQYDVVSRLGGDEFAILFPETDVDEARAIAGRLQQALHDQVEGEFAPLTYSLGVVTFSSPPPDVADCLAEVDRRLYEAKRAGKRTVSFGLPSRDPAPSAT
jgi:diguanylate cyclase (GGDEF)-like protein